LYRSCCGFSSKKPQFSSIFHGFLRFSQKQDGILRGIPPCCSFFLFSAYSCAPHLLQNSASSETVEALREYGDEFAERVLEVMEEAGIDTARRAYK